MIRHALAISLLFLPTSLAAAPTVSVVVGSKAPPLELDAAGELTSQWKKVFGVEARLVRDRAPDTDVTVLVGSPTTNPAIAKAIGKAWPLLVLLCCRVSLVGLWGASAMQCGATGRV